MSTYTIRPTNGEKPYDIEADRADHETSTGATIFYSGDEVVARLLNVSFNKKADNPATKAL